MVVDDIIRSALTKLGVLPIGEPVPAEWTTNAFNETNEMLQVWAVEGLLLHALTTTTVILTPSVATYTIGAGGVINVRRPVELVDAVLTVTASDLRRLEVYNALFRYRQYNQLPIGTPREVFYDPQFALGTVTFYYTPDSAYSVNLTMLSSQVPFVASTDTITLPPEYQSAMALNLAVRLMPIFGKSDALVMQQAQQALGALLTNNSKRMTRDHAKLDSALTGTRNSDNILTGWL